MPKSTLVEKLHIKSGFLVSLINPPPGYRKRLEPLPEGTRLMDTSGKDRDAVHLFVKNVDELNKYAQKAMDVVKFDGLLWISYPKQSSKIKTDINRDVAWKMELKKGMQAVSAVSIDDIWSALRFRPIDKVGK